MTQKIVEFLEVTMKECNITFVHEATKFAYRPGARFSKVPIINGPGVEASNVINDPKCNKGPKCNNVWP